MALCVVSRCVALRCQIWCERGLKLAFHDADADTDTNILATILARMSVSWNASFNKLQH